MSYSNQDEGVPGSPSVQVDSEVPSERLEPGCCLGIYRDLKLGSGRVDV